MGLIEILLVEYSPSDANLPIKDFLNAKIADNLHWVEDVESAMNYLPCCLQQQRIKPYLNK